MKAGEIDVERLKRKLWKQVIGIVLLKEAML